MNMRLYPTACLAALCLFLLPPACVRADVADTLQSHELPEVRITTSPKEGALLRHLPASSSLLDGPFMAARGVEGMKDVGTMVPNLFIPDYGSRQTGAMYMRGIGSRIGSPAVGLYVDNLPYYDKSAYDFAYYDVESIEVLRGPQSTLYGRNTMGGLIRVKTRSPFAYEGTDARLGYATGDNRRQASVTHYHRVSDKYAFVAGGFYDGSSGFFDNDMTGKSVDASETGGGRLRAIYMPTGRLTLDASLRYEYTDGGAYPYYYTGAAGDNGEEYAGLKGLISSNLEGRYRRSLLAAGLHAEYLMNTLALHSVTSYQNVRDRMFMDQDFIRADIYSLEQKPRINILSEELTLTGFRKGNARGLLGAAFFYEWLGTEAPVVFRKDGVEWLNATANSNANRYMPEVQSGPMKMGFLFSDNIQGDALPFLNDFSTPTLGASVFHQSTFSDIFGLRGLSASVGLRLDYEKLRMDYDAWYAFSHVYGLKGRLSAPGMNREIVLVPEREYQAGGRLEGRLSDDYLQLLPKFTLKYDFASGNVYASVGRGFRSGGYNVQNISELMRVQMQADMMTDVRDATVPVLQAQPAVPAEAKETITGILNAMAGCRPADVGAACLYAPEYAWNYELGTHLSFLGDALKVDAGVFLSDVHDLQLSRMSETGLGRVTVNAGRSRSAGVEASVSAAPCRGLLLRGSYGFTHATFRRYVAADASGKDADCRGNYVPYMPLHTFDMDAAYTFAFRDKAVRSLTLGAGCSGAGRIYWDEPNDSSQPLYALLSARVSVSFDRFDVQLWGRNLTDTHYDTFRFVSMGRGYAQRGKPVQLGIDLRLRL